MLENIIVYDYIGWFFWTITYIVIIVSGIVNKKSYYVGIPVMPVLVNFSWEIASVILPTNFLRQVWFFFDIFIIALIFKKQNLKQNKKRFFSYLFFLTVCTIIFYYIFKSNTLILPISSFFIDTVMAIIFLIQKKKIDATNRITISIMKFLGDFFVWIYYSQFHPSISVMAAITFICNIIYIIYAFKEKKVNPDVNKPFIQPARTLLKALDNQLFPNTNDSYTKRKYKKKVKTKKTHRKK